MSDRIVGEVIALTPVADVGGEWRLAAVVATAQGAQVGVLVAPANGVAGALRFEPVPRLAEGLDADGLAAMCPPAAVPDVDPNDPRGLRRGGPRRAPGMVG